MEKKQHTASNKFVAYIPTRNESSNFVEYSLPNVFVEAFNGWQDKKTSKPKSVQEEARKI